MTEMRVGRKLSRRAGACTLYVVTPGDDREADVCIGAVASAELAALIVAAVNGELPQVRAAEIAAEQRRADLGEELRRRTGGAVREAARAERERCADLLTTGTPLDFLRRHGLAAGATTRDVLGAAAAEIRKGGNP